MKIYKYNSEHSDFLVKNRVLRKTITILTILLILSFCLIFSISCSEEDTVDTDIPSQTDTAAPDSSGRVLVAGNGTTSFRIVRSAECEDYVRELSNELRNYIKKKTNVNVRVISDSTPHEEGTLEILVGKTNREGSVGVYEGIKYNDWRIAAEKDGVAIAAYAEGNLDFAIERFSNKLIFEDGKAYYEPFTEEKLRSYDVATLTLGGYDVAEYAIVCEESELAFAQNVRTLIAERNGYVLSVFTSKRDLPKGTRPFYIGSNVYPGEADKREELAYMFASHGDGVSLWYYGSSTCIEPYALLEKALEGKKAKIEVGDILTQSGRFNEEGKMDIKIMSFNVLNGWNTNNIGERDDLAAAKILLHMPDVIGFQEFDPYYREATNPLPKLIESVYTEANVTGGTATTDMSWNPIFYNAERLTLKMCGSEVFTDGTFHTTYPHGGKSMFRTISWAIFEDKVSKQSFIFVNTHYDYSTDKATTDYNQRSEAYQLVALVNKLKTTYGLTTVFVTGDYNATTDGIPSKIMKDAGFADTWAIAETKDNITSVGTLNVAVEGAYAWAIDHVFYMAESIEVSEYKTITDIRAASDHCPVIVTLTVNSVK